MKYTPRRLCTDNVMQFLTIMKKDYKENLFEIIRSGWRKCKCINDVQSKLLDVLKKMNSHNIMIRNLFLIHYCCSLRISLTSRPSWRVDKNFKHSCHVPIFSFSKTARIFFCSVHCCIIFYWFRHRCNFRMVFIIDFTKLILKPINLSKVFPEVF